jgi:hypothetical protein
MSKTKLDVNDHNHKHLIALMAKFVGEWGYSPNSLYELLEDSKNQLHFALTELHYEKNKYD